MPTARTTNSCPILSKGYKEGSGRRAFCWESCVADTGYSSGENYALLEARGLKSFIPPHGTYKGGPDGFFTTNRKTIMYAPKEK